MNMQTYRDRLARLVSVKGRPNGLVTIYLPVSPLDGKTNELRLRALVEQLAEMPENLLRDLAQLELYRSMNHRVEGMCIYSSPEETVSFRVPFAVPSLCVSGSTFFMSPLFVNLNQFDYRYVLALSQNCPRLFRVDLLSIEECALPDDLTGKLFAKMEIDESKDTLQYHSSGRYAAGGRSVQSSTFHGHGDRREDLQNVVLADFFKTLEDAVVKLLPDLEKPLILGGTDDNLNLMRRVAKRLKFANQTLGGNFDSLNIDLIHDKVLPLLHECIAEDIDRSQVSDRPLVHDTGDIIERSSLGAVDSLYIERDYLYDQLEKGDEGSALLETAARNTVLAGGKIFRATNPDIGPMGARLRYV